MRKISVALDSTLNSNDAELAISGFLTVAMVRQICKNPDGYTIVLDDRKNGTKTEVPYEGDGTFISAVHAAGRALLQAAEDAQLDDLDSIRATALADSFQREGITAV